MTVVTSYPSTTTSSSSSKASRQARGDSTSPGHNEGVNNDADSQAKAELVTLVLWLQTFPEFELLGRNKCLSTETVMDHLSTSASAMAIWQVAKKICGEQELSSNHQTTTVDKIWTALLVLTTTRARSLTNQEETEIITSLNPPRLKSFVLSSLLACAVKSESNEIYINRIIQLPEAVKEELMDLIEKRTGGRKSKSKTKNPTSRNVSARTMHCNSPSSTTPRGKQSEASFPMTPPSSRMAQSTSKNYMVGNSQSRETPPLSVPLFPSNKKDTAARFSSHSNNINSNHHVQQGQQQSPSTVSNASSKPTYSTPPRRPPATKWVHARSECSPIRGSIKSSPTAASFFLSPGTAESPHKLLSVVVQVREQNQHLQSMVENYQARADQQLNRIAHMEAIHRQDLLHHETISLERLQEVQDKYETQHSILQSQLARAQYDASTNGTAAEELRNVREQLEEYQHHSRLLDETQEKLRRYKSKTEELHDIQQQYEREQEAHANCVQEIVRLESQVSTLEPYKRQVEDYKARVVETEVKLAEAQDNLQRLKQANKDQNLTNQYLWKGAIQQKEQLEEMQRRIQQESNTQSKTLADAPTERISPELQAELARLRSENVKLRAFADQRQDDVVSTLERDYDDAQRLLDTYKSNYLTTKALLEGANTELADTKQCLQTTTEQLTMRAEKAESTIIAQESIIDRIEMDLLLTRESLQLAQDRIGQLEQQVQRYKSKLDDANQVAQERLDQLETSKKLIDKTNSELDMLTKQCERLLDDLNDQENQNKELQERRSQLEKDLQSSQEELNDARSLITEQSNRLKELGLSLSRVSKSESQLQQQLQEEKQAHVASQEEGYRSLEATRSVLMAQSKKQVEEIKENMNILLEDERRAYRVKDEEHFREVSDLKNQFENQNQRLSMYLEEARQSYTSQIESMKRDYQSELEKAINESAVMQEQLNRDLSQMKLDYQNQITKTNLFEERNQRLSTNLQEAHQTYTSQIENMTRVSQSELQETKNEFAVKEEQLNRDLTQMKIDYQNQITKIKDDFDAERTKILQDGKTEREKLITRGKGIIDEIKSKGEKERQQLGQHIVDFEQRLENAEDKYNNLLSELAKANEHNADLLEEVKDQTTKIKIIESEQKRLLEDNAMYKRQICSGAQHWRTRCDNQIERLEQELKEVIQENDNLKLARKSGGESLENGTSSSGSTTSKYSTGQTIASIYQEYDKRIEVLTRAKRALVMQCSACTTDARHAEQRVWERDQELWRMKEELRAKEVELQKMELECSENLWQMKEELRANGLGCSENDEPENQSPDHHQDADFLSLHSLPPAVNHPKYMGGIFDDKVIIMSQSPRPSPSVNRKMKNLLHKHIPALAAYMGTDTGTPSRYISSQSTDACSMPTIGLLPPRFDTTRSSIAHNNQTTSKEQQVLSPTHRHQNAYNIRPGGRFGDQHKNDSLGAVEAQGRRQTSMENSITNVSSDASYIIGQQCGSSPPTKNMSAMYKNAYNNRPGGHFGDQHKNDSLGAVEAQGRQQTSMENSITDASSNASDIIGQQRGSSPPTKNMSAMYKNLPYYADIPSIRDASFASKKCTKKPF